jgi:uncharacterized repeat protein (TIGR01451 family)
MKLLGVLAVTVCLLASSAHSGQNPVAKIAVHIEARDSQRTCNDLPGIETCPDMTWTYDGCGDVDVFPVVFDLYGCTAVQYRLVWPPEWGSGVHTHCADLAIGDIRQSGDGMVVAWQECQINPYCIPGWLSLTATTPGTIAVSPGWSDQYWDVLIVDCLFQEDEPFWVFDGGICGVEGEYPCGAMSRLAISKVDGVGAGCVAAGQPISYTITFSNPWSSPNVYDLAVVDELPAPCEFVEATGGGVYEEMSHTVTWYVEKLSRGESDTVGVLVTVGSGVQPGEMLDNYCDITSDGGRWNETHCFTHVCGRVPVDLSVGAAFAGECLAPRDSIAYSLTYGTPGQPADIHNVVLIDTLPPCLELAWATGDYTYDPETRTVRWDLGSLAPETSGSEEITALATWECAPNAVLSNTCAIHSDETEPARASADARLCDFGLIVLAKVDDVGGGCIHPGDTLTYTISFGNPQPTDFHDVVLTDSLAAGVIFVSASGSGTYDPGSHAITWPVGPLPAGSDNSESALVEVREDWIYEYRIENRCEITSAETGPVRTTLRTSLCGTSREGMAAIHVLPRDASRTCTENFPEVEYCEEIRWTEAACEVDFFTVFFGLDEYQGFEYGLTWPAEWGSISFVSCSDMAIGEIVHPGDGISQTWSECRTGNLIFTGYGRVDATGPGRISIIAHPTWYAPKVITCHYGSYAASVSFSGGVCGAEGDEPCPGGPQRVQPTTWGAIKAMFK